MTSPKSPTPRKPRPDFPLFPHARGYWAKKVNGQLRYFGRVADDPQGKAALLKWLDHKDALLAGREPRTKTPEATAVKDVCNAFLSHKKDLLAAGELTERTFAEYHATCTRLVKAFGRTRPVDDLVADDFGRYRAQIARHWGPVRLATEVQRVRSIFKHGFESGLLDKSVRFGPDFKKPSAKVLRKNRADAGPRMFEREEVLALLAVAGPNLKAMILLAINGGLGNNDLATLPFSAVNVKSGWLTHARPKTGIERIIPLWPETVEAVEAAIAQRPVPKESADKQLVFIGPSGKSYLGGNSYRVTGVFVRVFNAAKIKPKRGFYALRHTFATVASGSRDQVAVNAIMGHTPPANDMSAVYRERIDDDRLLAVTEHVRKWLFRDTKQE
jgi:integrase